MTQPTPFNRSTTYTGDAYTGADLDEDFDNAETTLDGLCDNLALIQRDDGLLANGSVHPDSLNTATLALMIDNILPRGFWATSTLYSVGDLVEEGGVSYVALVEHVAGTFSTDLASEKWMALLGEVGTATGINTSGDPVVIDPTPPTAGQVLTATSATEAEWATPGTSLTGFTTADNTGLGVGAGDSITSGVNNTFVGTLAGTANTSGSQNDAFGSEALKSATTANVNAAFGAGALTNTTTGAGNAAFGGSTLASNTTGSFNAACGYQALPSVTTGSNNVGVGKTVGTTLTTGSNNTLVGHTADVDAAAAANRVVVGQGAIGTADNTVQLGDASVTHGLIGNAKRILTGVTTVGLAASDETTALTAGTGKVTFRMPHTFTVTAVRASLTTAQTSGSIFTVDINESGTTILSTKLTIDNTEKTSTTAATAAVISDTALADDAEITVDIDQIGDSTAKGLKVWILGYIP